MGSIHFFLTSCFFERKKTVIKLILLLCHFEGYILDKIFWSKRQHHANNIIISSPLAGLVGCLLHFVSCLQLTVFRLPRPLCEKLALDRDFELMSVHSNRIWNQVDSNAVCHSIAHIISSLFNDGNLQIHLCALFHCFTAPFYVTENLII